MVCIVPSAHVAQLGEHPPPGGRSTGWSCSGARCILLAWMAMVGGSGRHQDQNMMSVIGAGAEFSSVGSEGMCQDRRYKCYLALVPALGIRPHIEFWPMYLNKMST